MQIKVNTQQHSCCNTAVSAKIRPASTKWIAATVLDWVREDPTVGPAELRRKLTEKFNVVFPYHRVFDGKEMALDMIQGKWNYNFHKLYSFKAEVEKTSPGSVVDIDYEFVRGRVKISRGKRYMMADKRCFRRCFVCLKACWKGFLDGCRPYLSIGSTALTGKFRGLLATATAVDTNNWIFPVAYAIIEGDSNESWSWFMERLRGVIGHPPGLVTKN